MSKIGKQVWDKLSPNDRYTIAGTRHRKELSTWRFPEYDFSMPRRKPPTVAYTGTSAGMAIMAASLMSGIIRRR